MDAADQNFQEEYKPVHIPSAYYAYDSWRNKAIYALSWLGSATAAQVGAKLHELEPGLPETELRERAGELLTGLYDKGLLKATANTHGELVFNLSKMTETNTGEDTDADQR